MNLTIVLYLLVFSGLAWSGPYQLERANADYFVKHAVKSVKGFSVQLSGEMICEKAICDFHISVPVKSFISSDSDRDLTMLDVLEEPQFPLITVRGRVLEHQLKTPEFNVPARVIFHGVEREYLLKIENNGLSGGNLRLNLDNHNIERPSLMMIKIDNEVIINFSFSWKKRYES